MTCGSLQAATPPLAYSLGTILAGGNERHLLASQAWAVMGRCSIQLNYWEPAKHYASLSELTDCSGWSGMTRDGPV